MKKRDQNLSARLRTNSVDFRPDSLETGEIRRILPDGLYQVRSEHGRVVIAHLDKSLRSQPIRLLIGDRVHLAPSRYRPSRGTILGRISD